MTLRIGVRRLHPQARLPQYMTEGAAGMDLFAALDEPVTLQPSERGLLPTGIALQLPAGFEGQVRPRSGLALRHGIALVNSPGTIDSDYRGEIRVIVINHGQEPFTFSPGDRLAQLVIAPVLRVQLDETEALEETCRGSGGFGHTGMRGEADSAV